MDHGFLKSLRGAGRGTGLLDRSDCSGLTTKALVLAPALAALLSAAVSGQNTPPLRPGFPVSFPGAGTVRVSQPAVGDLDNDGVKEIVFGTTNRKVYAIRANGSVMPGWPVTLPAEINSSPVLADIDGDGFLDVIVACGSTFDPTGNGGLFVFRRNGTLIWSYTPFDSGFGRPAGIFSTPAVGDLDGDGRPEIVVGCWDFRIYAFRWDGTLMPGWPPTPYAGMGPGVRDTVWSSPALADLDGDGKLEVIIGSDTHAEGPPINTPDGGAIHVFRYDGTEFPGFPQFVDQTIYSSPAIGDIDGDGNLDIVVGGGTFYTGAVGRKVYAWRRNGTFVPGWPVTVNGQVFNSPALADLDGDGKPEVIISDEPNGGTGPFLYAFRGDGTLLNGFPMQPRSFFASTPNLGSPIVADVNGDGQVEILVATNTEIAVVSRTGVQLTDPGPPPGDSRVSYYTNTAVSGAVVTDLEGDGTVDVIVASGDPFPSPTDAKIYVWNPAAVGPAPWPMFRKELQRRSFFGPAAIPASPGALRLFTVTPCRVADTRVSSPLAANTLRLFQISGVCGIPPTARAVVFNVTMTQPSSLGDVRLFRGGASPPLASTANFRAGQTRANNTVIPLSALGDIGIQCDMSSGSVHAILDVSGYFQ